jgi:hypothetical protein
MSWPTGLMRRWYMFKFWYRSNFVVLEIIIILLFFLLRRTYFSSTDFGYLKPRRTTPPPYLKCFIYKLYFILMSLYQMSNA